MKKKYFGLALLSLIFLISACHDKPQRNVKGVEASEQTDTKDSTIYGVCGDGTMIASSMFFLYGKTAGKSHFPG